MKAIQVGILILVAGLAGFSETGARPDREKLIGAWRLVSIAGPDGKQIANGAPAGMLIYTNDGHVSVQLMYPKSEKPLSNEYVENGYEASFGTYDVDSASHTLTHHVRGSNTRERLLGKDLPRLYEFNGIGQLIIKPARADEHWFVTWEHY